LRVILILERIALCKAVELFGERRSGLSRSHSRISNMAESPETIPILGQLTELAFVAFIFLRRSMHERGRKCRPIRCGYT
jgi:hypothetical protein